MSTAQTETKPRRLSLPPEMAQMAYRLLAAAVICAALSVLSDVFFTASNLLNILRQTALLFLLASGLTLVILTAGLDLSVGANVALSACLAATVIKGTGSARSASSSVSVAGLPSASSTASW